jgi:hypothetical protein
LWELIWLGLGNMSVIVSFPAISIVHAAIPALPVELGRNDENAL